jgi:hypothetical protein
MHLENVTEHENTYRSPWSHLLCSYSVKFFASFKNCLHILIVKRISLSYFCTCRYCFQSDYSSITLSFTHSCLLPLFCTFSNSHYAFFMHAYNILWSYSFPSPAFSIFSSLYYSFFFSFNVDHLSSESANYASNELYNYNIQWSHFS